MKLSRYPAYKDNENSFWFISNGKAGNIAKAVFFQELPEENRFNLAMGDYQKVTDEINFKELTNNGDARKVFVTIAHIVEYYTSKHPEREIFLAGNTNDKKRTYSIMVSGYLEEIIVDFDVKGGDEGGMFEPFIKDKIYDAILVKRK